MNGLSWACLCAGRLQSNLLPVIAKCAFEGAAILLIFCHDSEGTGHDAIGAAVADVRLHEYSAEFSANDRSGGASLKATRFFTVLADVRRKSPRSLLGSVAAESGDRRLLDELHMSPGGGTQGSGVVIRIAAPIQAIFTDTVPFLASYLACLASDS